MIAGMVDSNASSVAISFKIIGIKTF